MEVITINDKDENYPQRLKVLKQHPKTLYANGNINLLNKISVAIVGSRNIDEYGIEQTKIFSKYLSQKGICIVSGLARGVDTIAHKYAKKEKGRTIAVIASGFNHIYPEENKKLCKEILEDGGCVISEYSPETEVDMHRFPIRNRIISGISVATVLTEADYPSGSTITAHNAFKQERLVCCVPGNLDKKRSLGCNKLIQEGAYLVTSPEDVLELLEFENYVVPEEKQIPTEYKEIYQCISNIPITPDEIARNTKKKINQISEALFMLEVDGLIKKLGFGKYILQERK